jgi:transcription elongation factor SPT5
MRDTIPGWIYLEAFALSAVHQVLAGIPSVIFAQDRTPITQAIPIEDRIPLLSMSDTHSIGRGSWVRLQTRGLYRYDLGFVLDFDQRTLDAQVAIVPRIKLGRDNAERPKRTLFDLEEVKRQYGRNSVEQYNQIHFFQGREFKNGLLEICLPIGRILTRNVNPTRSELELFTQCTDSSIVEAGYRELLQFNLHDRVEVIAGQLGGLEGRLANTAQHGNVVIHPTAAIDLQPIRAREIRKKFRLGDLVKIISGEHQGVEGFIIGLDDENCVTLYRLPPGGLYSSSEGLEVRLACLLV